MAYYIHDGETCTGIILEYDQMFVSSGGTANSTIINTSGYLEVDSGGTAIDTIINDRKSGGLFITLGGVANGATVNYGGYMRILPDGKAKNVVENGGYVYIDEELEKGISNVTFRKNSFSGVVLSGYDTGEKRKATVQSGTTANNTTVKSYGVLEILGGIANGTTVVSGGDMIIFSGTANNTVVNSDGYVCISSGGVANDVTVNFGGYMKVFSEGKAKNVVENGGYVYIVDELENGHPNVTFKKNSFSGVVLYDEKRKASVHSG
ncbi:MAG: AIDA repeat-containing protein, partial [Clostridia bacterium]|nr:AIDA repeat-containing protein [Clostridia bacterium]